MTARSLKHKFTSAIADAADATLVRPSQWNDDHDFYLGVNAQTGTSYAIANSDQWSLITFNNASAVSASIAQAGAASAFLTGWAAYVRNLGAGTVTITPATSTINGGATLSLLQGEDGTLVSDGANYVFLRGTLLQFAAAAVVTSSSSSAFTVGRQGATNPALQVDASAPSSVTGVKVTAAANGSGVGLAAISQGSNENLAVDAKGTGTLTLQGTATGAITLARNTGITGTATVTSSGASGLAVGPNGATNPTLQVDGSTASAATGLKVKSAAAAGGLALSVITSGTNENLTIDAAGSGTITLGGTSTGAITLTRATTLSAALTYGGVTLSNAVTGTGNMVLSASPTLTGTLTGAAANFSGVVAINGTAAAGEQLRIVPSTAGSGRVLIGDLNTSNSYDGLHVQGANDASNGGVTAFSRTDAGGYTTAYVNLSYSRNDAFGVLTTSGGLAFNVGNTNRAGGYNTAKDGMTIGSAGGIRFPLAGTTASAANAFMNGADQNNLLRSTSTLTAKDIVAPLTPEMARNMLSAVGPEGYRGFIYTSLCEADDPSMEHVGFGAEWEAVIDPRFVMRGDDGKPNGVAYERYVVPLVVGFDDHESRIAALEARISGVIG